MAGTGFNKQTLSLWVSDQIKTILLVLRASPPPPPLHFRFLSSSSSLLPLLLLAASSSSSSSPLPRMHLRCTPSCQRRAICQRRAERGVRAQCSEGRRWCWG